MSDSLCARCGRHPVRQQPRTLLGLTEFCAICINNARRTLRQKGVLRTEGALRAWLEGQRPAPGADAGGEVVIHPAAARGPRAADAPLPFGRWAIVEIVGHRVRAGRVSEASVCGQTMLRIDCPCGPDDAAGYVTEYYAGSAIFALRPTDEQTARRLGASMAPPAASPRPPLVLAAPDAGDDLDDDIPF